MEIAFNKNKASIVISYWCYNVFAKVTLVPELLFLDGEKSFSAPKQKF
jgi:hypothetical protein